MIFLAMVGFIIGVFLPWWSALIWAFTLGIVIPKGWKGAVSCSIAAGCVWAAAAFYMNGYSHGTIAPRMAALFHLPSVSLIFAATGLIAAILVFPAYWLGVHSKIFFK